MCIYFLALFLGRAYKYDIPGDRRTLSSLIVSSRAISHKREPGLLRERTAPRAWAGRRQSEAIACYNRKWRIAQKKMLGYVLGTQAPTWKAWHWPNLGKNYSNEANDKNPNLWQAECLYTERCPHPNPWNLLICYPTPQMGFCRGDQVKDLEMNCLSWITQAGPL